MYRCPTCVSVLTDATVRRCPVCRQSFKRTKPTIIGLQGRCKDQLTSWDLRATIDAGRMYGQDEHLDLPAEHLRDISGRTAAADRR